MTENFTHFLLTNKVTVDSPLLEHKSSEDRLFFLVVKAWAASTYLNLLTGPAAPKDWKRPYDTIRYDSVYLTCSKKLTGSQLSLPHGINKKLICETKNKKNDDRDRSGPVPLSCGSPVGKRNLRWEGFVEKVSFEPGVKEWRSDGWWEWGWYDRDELVSGWGGESRQEWWGWRNESGSWFQRRGDAYLNWPVSGVGW